MIQVEGNRLVDGEGRPFQVKGVAVHGALHEERYDMATGPETLIYEELERRIGKEASEAWFERMQGATFDDADAKWLSERGFNCIRVSFSWRHFGHPERFHRILDLCKKWGLKCIFDLHAAPGQNPDGHSDSVAMRPIFWEYEGLREDALNGWYCLAGELSDCGEELLGYELLNEPVTTLGHTRHMFGSVDDWGKLNAWYHEVIEAIRKFDPNRIIVIDGDWYSQHYEGLAMRGQPNVVLSPHHYVEAALDPNYTRTLAETQAEIDRHQVWDYAEKTGLPMLWTEFGPMSLPYNDFSESQLEATELQRKIYEERSAGWFYWTWKDSMGLVRPTEWEKATWWLTEARLELGADYLGSITPPGMVNRVRTMLVNEHGLKCPGIEGINAVLEKYLRRAAQEGIVYEWGEYVEKNPDCAELWRLEHCIEQPGIMGTLFD